MPRLDRFYQVKSKYALLITWFNCLVMCLLKDTFLAFRIQNNDVSGLDVVGGSVLHIFSLLHNDFISEDFIQIKSVCQLQTNLCFN